MQILINIPDNLLQAVIQQQIKEFEEKLKKQVFQPKKHTQNGKKWCKE